jgi:hypothetical protein
MDTMHWIRTDHSGRHLYACPVCGRTVRLSPNLSVEILRAGDGRAHRFARPAPVPIDEPTSGDLVYIQDPGGGKRVAQHLAGDLWFLPEGGVRALSGVVVLGTVDGGK